MIYKTTPQKLLLAFALIMDRNNGRFDARAVALALEELKEYIFINEDFKFISKVKFFEMLDYFYEKSQNKKVKKIPKSKFYKKYFKYLIKKGILKKVKNLEKTSPDSIFILSISKGFLSM